VNNIRQLNLALNSFETAHSRYPSGGWGHQWYPEPDRGSNQHQPGGWPYSLLPYLEQTPLYEHLKKAEPDQQQEALTHLLTTPIPLLYCPSRRSPGLYYWEEHEGYAFPYNLEDYPVKVAKSDYVINGGDNDPQLGNIPMTLEQGDDPQFPWQDFSPANGICYLRSMVKPAAVTDGLSNTYSFGEKWATRGVVQDRGDDTSFYCGFDKDNTRWTNLPPIPDDRSEGYDQFGSAHPSVCNFAFCDGSVRGISFHIDPQIHRYLGARDDEQVISLPK
jgi:prepilin-type processing-associated H-X9-DG protein